MPKMKKRFVMVATNETLYGSFMAEPLDGLGLLIKLLCFSREGRYPGYIQAEYNRGIVPHQLAAILNIPFEQYQTLMREQVDAGRITVNEHGVIDILNWEKYQAIPKWNGKPGTDKPDSDGTRKCTRCSYQEVTDATECPRCSSPLVIAGEYNIKEGEG